MNLANRLQQLPQGLRVTGLEGHGHEDSVSLPLKLRRCNEGPWIDGQIGTGTMGRHDPFSVSFEVATSDALSRGVERIGDSKYSHDSSILNNPLCRLLCAEPTPSTCLQNTQLHGNREFGRANT